MTKADGRAATAAAETARRLTGDLVVTFVPGTEVRGFALEKGFVVKRRFMSDENTYWLTPVSLANTTRSGKSAPLETALKSLIAQAAFELSYDTRVVSFYADRYAGKKTMFVPNDPYFQGQPQKQWHLYNPFTPGLDVNVLPAWARETTGLGVTIGIIDTGFESFHPDLNPAYRSDLSFDFGQNDGVADPVFTDDDHGTSVAGVVAARGGNGIGVTGAAPFASLSNLRVDFHNGTDAQFADAQRYKSVVGNNPIAIKNQSYGIGTAYISDPIGAGSDSDSAAAGTVICVSAGNERSSSAYPAYPTGDANQKGVQANADVITVAALASDGKFAYYSNFGASVFVTAPSSGVLGVLTTDRLGGEGYNTAAGGGDGDPFTSLDYTSTFGGTSSSSPLVAGVLALVKQAQPLLDVRFAKHLLARTSRVVDANDSTLSSDGGWRANAAGFKFNPDYGFGLIDADALCRAAPNYAGVTALTTYSNTISPNLAIADGTGTSYTNLVPGAVTSVNIPITAPSTAKGLEAVIVTIGSNHTFSGDLQATLTSPSGTTRNLMRVSNGRAAGTNWTWKFSANGFWGEKADGTWTLKIADYYGGDTGTLQTVRIDARTGSPISKTSLAIAAPATGRYSDPIGVSGTLTSLATAAGISGRNLVLTSDGSTVAQSTTDGDGVAGFASLTGASFGVGQHSIALGYTGQDDETASSATTILTVTRRLSGTMVFQDVTGAAPATATVEVRQPGTTTVVATLPATLSSGGYTIDSALNGAYDLSLKVGGFLRQTRRNVALAGGDVTVDFSLVNGDADGDNQVTLKDYSLVRAAQGSVSGGAGYSLVLDPNRDGTINANDLAIVQKNLRKTGDN